MAVWLKDYDILVTGGGGFLGSRLVAELADMGASVVAYDRVFPKMPSTVDNPVRFISGSFNDVKDILSAQISYSERKKKAVIHLAGMANAGECERNPEQATVSNVHLTSQILEFCRLNRISKIVFPSTGLVYGDKIGRPAVESDNVVPVNIYTATKLASEAMLCGYSRTFSISAAILRLGNIYGPGMSETTVLGTILNQALGGLDELNILDGTPVRDFIYLDDIVEGIIRVLISLNEPGCQAINLSTGIGTSVYDAAKTVLKIIGKSITINETAPNINNKSYLVLDNTFLQKITGWKPVYSLEEGLTLILQQRSYGCPLSEK